MIVDRWDVSIAAQRCPTVADDHRCQLWAGHSGQPIDHAAAWADPRTHTPGETYRARPVRHWLRWDDTGDVREVEVGSARLPWAAMGRD